MTSSTPKRKSTVENHPATPGCGCITIPSISADPQNFLPFVDGASNNALSRPSPIGEFSLDATRKQQLGRSMVRYLYEPVLASRKMASTNLAQGIADFKPKDCGDEGIDQILRWICTMAAPNSSLKKTIHECDVVIWRGTLTRLLVSCYDVSSFSVGIKVACVKHRGVYFFREFDTQAKVLSEASRSDYQRRASFAGFKFEQVVTTGDLGQRPDGTEPVEQSNEFIGIFKATLNGPVEKPKTNGAAETPQANGNGGNRLGNGDPIRLFYGAEIDCISPNGQFMELKTQYKSIGYGKGYPSKALKWWVQSYLIGIRQLVVGLHENFILNRVELLPIDQLQKCFAKEAGFQSEVCFLFLHKFLQQVRRCLDDAVEEGAVLVAERLPTSTEFRLHLLEADSDPAKQYPVLSQQFKVHGWR